MHEEEGFKTKSDRKSSNFIFQWTKPMCQNIMLGIRQSCLQFPKTKDINSCLKQHRKQFPMGTRKIDFKVPWGCANKGQISSSAIISTVLL